jgi:hypothetical protein
MTGAFGFIADELFNLATAMVFGSTASASSWEAFRRAIKALMKVFANRADLVIKHKQYLDMIRWETLVYLSTSLQLSLAPSIEGSSTILGTGLTYQLVFTLTMQ